MNMKISVPSVNYHIPIIVRLRVYLVKIWKPVILLVAIRDMQFWKYIRAKHKNDIEISTITVDGKPCTYSKAKAEALNNYF